MKKHIGFDLGGTNLKAGIVDVERGAILFQSSAPTLAREGHDAVMARMGNLIDTLINSSSIPKSDIGSIGIGAPGVLDVDKGRVLFLPNLPGTWPNVPLADTVQDQTNLPVYLLNDVRAITYGEWKYGAGRGANTMACFAIGTGIGGGLVINGQLHMEFGGRAAELGHQVIDYNGPACGCGGRGCIEVYASGPAIAAMGMKAVTQGLTTSIGELVDYDLNRITPKLIAQAAEQGDAIAQDIYEQAGFHLGIGVSNVITSLGTRKVVIGGGVAEAGALLLDPIRRTVLEHVKLIPVEEVEIVPSKLGRNAGILGVALWASEQVRQT